MPREFSEDLCWRIIYLYTEGLLTTEIANTLHMSKGTVNKIKKRYNRWGRAPHGSGRVGLPG